MVPQPDETFPGKCVKSYETVSKVFSNSETASSPDFSAGKNLGCYREILSPFIYLHFITYRLQRDNYTQTDSLKAGWWLWAGMSPKPHWKTNRVKTALLLVPLGAKPQPSEPHHWGRHQIRALTLLPLCTEHSCHESCRSRMEFAQFLSWHSSFLFKVWGGPFKRWVEGTINKVSSSCKENGISISLVGFCYLGRIPKLPYPFLLPNQYLPVWG